MPYQISVGLKRAWADYCKTGSYNGFKYLRRKNIIERLLWMFINILLIGSTINLFKALSTRFLTNNVISYLKTVDLPVKEVDFPGISICDLNKISKKKSDWMAAKIANWTGHNLTYMLEHIKLLGNLYDRDFLNVSQLMEFQLILEDYGYKRYKDDFSIYKLMEGIAPSCEEFLSNCRWGNQKMNCNELFVRSITYEGFCCTFNNLKNTIYLNHTKTEPVHQDDGINMGLTVKLNFNLSDYSYTSISGVGGTIQIFNSGDYPDEFSGSLTHKLFDIGKEIFVDIKPISELSSDAILKYDVDIRACIFGYEKRTSLGLYTESDCLVDCRKNSMLSLCDCVPFILPLTKKLPICSLADLQCLKKHEGKWNSHYPSGELDDKTVLERELDDSLRCPNRCYATCDNILYEVDLNSVHLYSYRHQNQSKPIKQGTENFSIVHIYYSYKSSNLFYRNEYFEWFEILSTFGGLIGLITGASLVSCIELFICLTYKVLHFAKPKCEVNSFRNKRNVKNENVLYYFK